MLQREVQTIRCYFRARGKAEKPFCANRSHYVQLYAETTSFDRLELGGFP